MPTTAPTPARHFEAMMPDPIATPFRPLTPAQERVAQLVARGLSYRRIAALLEISTRTARAHVQAIAALLPADELPAYRRVQVWAATAYGPEAARRSA